MNDKRRLERLQLALDERQAYQERGREWTPENAVHQDDEHILAVLRTLRDVGALGDVLKDEGLEADALELLRVNGI